MRDMNKVTVLSILALALVLVIVVAIAINPFAGAALGPLLLGVAKVIKAIADSDDGDDGDGDAKNSNKAADNAGAIGEPNAEGSIERRPENST